MNEFQQKACIKIISGGQTGVDIASLRAAQCLGYKTGGYAPKKFKTQKGNQPNLGKGFGLVEHAGGYFPRTRANVMLADATLIIAANMESTGTKLTMITAVSCSKPLHSIQVIQNNLVDDVSINQCADWIMPQIDECVDKTNMFILNIAGNATSSAPGIFVPSYIAVLKILHIVQQRYEKLHNLAPDERLDRAVTEMATIKYATALQDNYNSYPELNPLYKPLLIIDNQ